MWSIYAQQGVASFYYSQNKIRKEMIIIRINKTCGIYCIENIITHKRYIGQSINIEDRWCCHKRKLNNNSHDNDYLQKSWNKYGESNFKLLILEICSQEDLDIKEIEYIEKYNTLDRDYGYNLKSGGQLCKNEQSEYIKQKISQSLKEYYKNNPDSRKKRSEKAIEQWSNNEIKNKILGKNNKMFGKKHTDESRKKMSDSKKGKPSTKRNMTPVLCIELNKIYPCAAIAAKELSISSSILEVCYGHRKTCGGYHWEFVNENNNS